MYMWNFLVCFQLYELSSPESISDDDEYEDIEDDLEMEHLIK